MTNYIKLLSQIKYNLYTSDIGLKLILITNKNATIISYRMHVKIGSINENNNELGISHFLEHMMFKGTKQYSETKLVDKLEMLGAYYNAATSYNYTEYEIQGLPQYNNEFINIILDMYFNPILPDSAVNNERKIILEEYKMRNDNKAFRAWQQFMKLITKEKNQLYGLPIIGTIDSINNITSNDLIAYRKNKYKYDNTTMIVSGNINIDETLLLIENIIKQNTNNNFKFKIDNTVLKNEDSNKINLSFDSSPKIKINNRVIFINDKDTEQSNIGIYFPSYPDHNINNFYVSVLTSIISIRMTKIIREKYGLSYSQSADTTTFNPFGFIEIYMGVNSSKLHMAIKVMFYILIDLYHNGIFKDELEKVKNSNLTGLMVYFQKQLSYFKHFTRSLTSGYKVKSFEELIDLFNTINVEKMNTIIKEIINPKQLYITIVGPRKPSYTKIKNLIIEFYKEINNKSNYKLKPAPDDKPHFDILNLKL